LGEDNGKDDGWIVNHYGSRRGFIRTFWCRLQYYFGVYREYKDIDWSSVERIVFVCKGNICRSAFAEAVARSLGVNAISCGLSTIEEAPANADAVNAAHAKGFDLGHHKTLPIMYVMLRSTDLLIAMEPWQLEFLNKNLYRKHQYTLMGLWAKPVLPHIQDPYGSSKVYFEKCFDYIQESVNELIKKK